MEGGVNKKVKLIVVSWEGSQVVWEDPQRG